MTFKFPFFKGVIILSTLTFYITTIQGLTPPDITNANSGGMPLPSEINDIQPFDINSDHVMESPHLRYFSQEVDSIMRADTISHVSVIGIASIDGPEQLNNRLAKARADAMARWLVSTTTIPDSIISIDARGEDWPLFRSLVEANSNIPGRQEILGIIDSDKTDSQKENEIRHLYGGETWTYLAKNVFPQMRCAEVMLDVKHRFLVPVPEKIIETEVVETVEVIEPEPVEEIEETLPLIEDEEWRRRFYIKTDLPYWLLSWSNLAFEVDIASHWSFNLPVYYSAVNYFKRNIKFRIFGFQPGFRYWFKPDNKGAYIEAHYGMAWYDFAFGGKYRYQDAWRKTPAIGGGLAAGYRMPISKNGRWTMEFGGGVGAYRLKYNRFVNEIDGKLIDTKKKTYFGIDNINVSISYSFPIDKRKGGGQ